jgi:superfamily II DNA or RNA helicase
MHVGGMSSGKKGSFIFETAFLQELASSPSVLSQAQALYDSGAVADCEWAPPILSGKVVWAEQSFFPKLNLKSRVLPECRCPCARAKKGQVCEHALALCIHLQNAPQAVLQEPKKGDAPQVLVKHLQLSAQKGLPLAFRIFLPPNLEVTAPKDAILVRIIGICEGKEIALESLNRGRAYHLEATDYKVAALIEGWCQGSYHGMLQLDRKRLQTLLEAAQGEPIVYWKEPECPLTWEKGILKEVWPHLAFKTADDHTKMALQKMGKPVAALHPLPSAVIAQKQMRLDGSLDYMSVALPDKNSAAYYPVLDAIKRYGFAIDAKTQVWWLRNRYKILQFLSEHYFAIKDQWGAEWSEKLTENTQHLQVATLEAVSKMRGSTLEIALELKAQGISHPILMEAISKGQPFVEDGRHIALLPPEVLDKLAKAEQGLSGERRRTVTPTFKSQVGLEHLADCTSLMEELSVNFSPPEDWLQRSLALRDRSKLKPVPVAPLLGETLRAYQHLGLAWLWHLYENRLGGILADEMGLGKTIQALGLLSAIHAKNPGKASLVVCPAGLVDNWIKEAKSFTPTLKIVAHHHESRLQTESELLEHDVVVTSYHTLTRELDFFSGIAFEVLIADEAQHIKNRKTQNSRSLKRIHAQSRFVLTGTPIENSIEDLRSLFDFIFPGYLVPPPPQLKLDDREWYENRIHSQVVPYILRRSKAMVAPELPDKIEQTIYCSLAPAQKAIYESYRLKTESEIQALEYQGASKMRIQFALFKQILRLRQVCAEPRLFEPRLDASESAKFQVLKELLEEAIDGDHRVLIFSQFVGVLQQLRHDLENMGISHLYLDGSVTNRVALCDQFNQDESIKVFLISLKAGGVGLNLTGADTVIHYDPWWNPAIEAQATDRAHRIGQKKIVTSIKLIAEGTIEERVLSLQRQKAHLLKGLFEKSEQALEGIGLEENPPDTLTIDYLKSLIQE